MSNGRYLPLDSSKIIFSSDYGYFSGNSLVIPYDYTQSKVHIKVQLKENKKVCKEFDMYIKIAADPELPSEAEILKSSPKKTKKKKSSLSN